MEPAVLSPEDGLNGGSETGRNADVGFVAGNDCLNCGATLTADFCSVCGQRRTRRLSFKGLAASALQAITSLDSGFAQTFVGMTLRPGHTVREYLNGRRTRYLNPLKYAFACTTLYVLLFALFEFEYYTPEQWRTAEGQERFKLVFSLVPYLIFAELVVSAGVQRLLFRRASYTVAECYVAQLFVFGHAVLYALPLAALGVGATPLGLFAIRLVPFLLLAWTLVQLYRKGVAATLAKSVLVFLTYFVASILASMIAIWCYYAIVN